jgi:hypothetical protein
LYVSIKIVTAGIPISTSHPHPSSVLDSIEQPA